METTRQQIGRILAEEYNALGPVVDARGDVIEPDPIQAEDEWEYQQDQHGAYFCVHVATGLGYRL